MIKSNSHFLAIKKIISSCLFLIATACCYGQATVLSGYVNNDKGEPLTNVTVLAKQGAIIKVYAVTSNAGRFQLSLQAKQQYSIELSSIGYNKLIINFTATTEAEQKYFTLLQKITAEDTVKIISKRGVYERGDTVFYNTDYYKRGNENNLKDLLGNMPGVTVTSFGKMIIDGQLVGKVLIDGKDLTGENYEKIINNLSPHGIDQIQVLKKYRDPYELSNSATGNTEMAVNITFKKKRVIPNAKISLGLGLPIKYYEHKADFLVLTKPITAINFINLNATGNTAQLISSPNSLFGNISTELFRKLGKGLQYQNNVTELFLKITKNFYSFNNTQFYDVSTQFNIGKKVTDKFTFNYTPEKIEQVENGFVKTFIGNQVLAETNSLNNPVIDKKVFSLKNELIYMLKKNEQIKWNLNYSAEKETSVNNSILNSTNVFFNNDNKKVFANSLVNYTKFLKRNMVVNVAGFYEVQKNTEHLTNTGVLYNNTIFSNSLGIAKSLRQNLAVVETNIGAYVKLIKRKKDYSFTFQPTFKKVLGNLQSDLAALANTDIFYDDVAAFKNDYTYEQRSLSMPVKYRFDNSNFEINLSVEPVFLKSQIHTITSNITNYNALISGNYLSKNKRRINFTLSRNNDFTFLSKLFPASAIVSNKNKMTSTNFLLTDQSYNFSVSTNKIGSYFNKPNFSYSVSGSINSTNYLLNTNSNNFYVTQNYFNYLPVNKSINVGAKNNFTPSKLKMRFENDFNFSFRKSFSSQNNIIVSSVSNAYQLDTKIVSRFIGMFNFQLNNSFSYSINKREGFSNVNKTATNVTGLDVNINYLKKSHLDIETRNFYFNTFTGNEQNVFLVNVSYKQLLYKSKLRLNLECRNITNEKAFISQNINVTQFSETAVTLLPFFALLKLEFLL
jgi:hypothetical protein